MRAQTPRVLQAALVAPYLDGFAFVQEVRRFWDGPVVLGGGISTGRAVRAADRAPLLREDWPQVADWIGGTRGRVHYHIKELEKAGRVADHLELAGRTEEAVGYLLEFEP